MPAGIALANVGLRLRACQRMPRIPILKLGLSPESQAPRLTEYSPALSLNGLLLGIDNLRHDVRLSPAFCEAAGSHIRNLIARSGKLDSRLTTDPPASAITRTHP